MKLLFYIICALCIVIETAAYLDLKKFLKIHRDEMVENNTKGLMKRCIFMLFVPVTAVVLMLILLFVYDKIPLVIL